MAWPLTEVLPIVWQLMLDGVWTNMPTNDVIRDPIVITAGRDDWADDVDPAECSFTLRNTSGDYSPRNPTGPYYGTLTRNTPVRFGIDNGVSIDWRFCGELASLPQRSDSSGTDVYVPVKAGDLFRRLGAGNNPAASAMKATVLASSDLQAYWTCEDEEFAERFASALHDGHPLDIRFGDPELAEDTAFDCSAALPVLRDSQWNGRVNGYAPTGEMHVRFLCHVAENGSVDGQALMVIKTSGSAAVWEILYKDDATLNDGALQVRVRDQEDTELLLTAEQFDGPDAIINGEPVQITIEMEQNGADIDFRMYLLSVDAATDKLTAVLTVTGQTLGRAKHVIVDPGGGHDDVTIGHIVVRSALVADPQNVAELNANAGETAGNRIGRLCAEYGHTFVSTGDLDDTAMMGPQRALPLVELLRECAATDGGFLHSPRDQLGVAYRTRRTLENQAAQVTLDYDAANLSDPFEPVDDDQGTRNDVTAKRDRGSSARAMLDEGPLSVMEPPDGVGHYTHEFDVNPSTDYDLPDHAMWRLHLGTVDESRYPQIAVNRARQPFRDDAILSQAIVDLALGDKVVVVDPPEWLPPDDIEQIVQGYEESISQFQHSLAWNCTPASPWYTARWPSESAGGDDEVGAPWARFGPLNTTVNEALDTTETGVDIAPGVDTWTTDANHFPFDIVIGGERMTVTGNSGTTLTVTRSVNGVVKTHAVGAPVRLWRRAIRPL
jgi:hypothetical protein